MRKAAEMTEAQIATLKAKRAAYMKTWRASLPKERIEAMNAKRRGRGIPVAELKPEVAESKRRRNREFMRRAIAKMTPEEKAAYLARRRSTELYSQRARRASSPELREKNRAQTKSYYWANPDRAKATQKVYRQKQRDRVLAHYGRFCACCGEDEPVFLTVDHTDGNGAAHRKTISKRSGASIDAWLIKNGFPTGFQILCFNCNAAKRTGAECPHRAIVRLRLLG